MARCTIEVYNQHADDCLDRIRRDNYRSPSPSISLVAGTYTIKAKAELVGDQVPANDEITGTVVVEAPLNGTYTVGAAGNLHHTDPGGR